MGLLFTLIEMLVHYEPGNPNFFNPEFWRRLPVYSVALPLMTWLLLEFLERGDRAGRTAGEASKLPTGSPHDLIDLLDACLSADSALSDEQRRALKRSLPPVIAALPNRGSQHSTAGKDDVVEALRRQIAQDLHDTLAQDMGYLHLKLNEFAISRPLQENAATRADIEYMRDVADEAYRQVRGMLASLNTVESGDLVSLLRERARIVSDRAAIDIRVAALGQSHSLPPEINHQILSIVREALNNVEKHARARSALIQLVWEENTLTVEIEDDGVGFDPESVATTGHLGLSVMCQRARAIDGKVTVTSAPGRGTNVLLWLPIS